MGCSHLRESVRAQHVDEGVFVRHPCETRASTHFSFDGARDAQNTKGSSSRERVETRPAADLPVVKRIYTDPLAAGNDSGAPGLSVFLHLLVAGDVTRQSAANHIPWSAGSY